MKRMIATLFAFSLCTAVFAAGGVVTVSGSNTALPAYMPITSTFELASYAKSRVAMAYAYGGSFGPVVPGGVTSVSVVKSSPDIRDISSLLSQCVLDFNVVLPIEACYFGSSMEDGDGNALFWGSSQFYLYKDQNGKWSVPPGAGNITMQLVDNVPIPAPGVTSAQVYVKDADGNVTGTSLNTWNGYVYFPKSLAGVSTNEGWTGFMTLYTVKGGTVYDMGSGQVVIGTPVKDGINTSISGLVTLDDPLQIKDNPKSVKGAGHRGWYQVKVSSTRAISLAGKTTEGEVAVSVTIRNADENAEAQTFNILPGQSLNFEFDEGVYDVWFNYPSFDPEEPVVPQYYYGNEKG